MTRYYPAYLDITGRRAVVIGGGAVSERKIKQLLASGANVTVVSPSVTPEIERLAAEGLVRWIKRAYARGDLAGAWVAVAATDDEAVNREAHAEAEREKTLLNVADVPELCGFIAPFRHRARQRDHRRLNRRNESGTGAEVAGTHKRSAEPHTL